MSNLKIQGNVSGSGTVTVVSPNTNNNYSLTLPSAGGELITKTITGGVSISAGNLSFDSGYGIDFSATPGTGTSELFNDYEEGTFTPTISSGYSVAPSTYTIQNGSYVKVGRFVHFQFVIEASGATANGSHLKFGGLPFTPGKQGSAVYAYQIGFNTNTGDTYAVETNNTTINVYANAGPQRAGNAAGINLNTRIDLCGFYQV